ncbi:hypothetical protein SDC9_151300 [bioreactor metagenome]|uniref:Uncharacterized protein n=1 Tax=bioreactor metagenome TaxID=1076179 RepID=A0A645EU90_9ZZZZ
MDSTQGAVPVVIPDQAVKISDPPRFAGTQESTRLRGLRKGKTRFTFGDLRPADVGIRTGTILKRQYAPLRIQLDDGGAGIAPILYDPAGTKIPQGTFSGSGKQSRTAIITFL